MKMAIMNINNISNESQCNERKWIMDNSNKNNVIIMKQ
jgi:hypothetical protein